MKKYLSLAVKLLILGVILWWIALSFDRQDWTNLTEQPKNWFILGLSLACVLLAHLISFVRWFFFLEALNVPIRIAESIRLGFLGNLFNFVSFGAVGGDLFKAIAAARQTPHQRPEVVASVLVDRALGLLGLIIVAAVSLQFLNPFLSATLGWIRVGAWLFTAIGLGGLALVVFIGHRLPTKLLQRLPWVGHTLYRMVSAGMLFEGRPWLVLGLLSLSCLVHVLLTIGMYFVSLALYADIPSLSEHFLTVPPAFAAAALPLTPGGLGIQEMAVAKLFEELPDLPETFHGMIVAAMYRLELIVVAAIGGIYYVLGAKELQQHRRQTDDRESIVDNR